MKVKEVVKWLSTFDQELVVKVPTKDNEHTELSNLQMLCLGTDGLLLPNEYRALDHLPPPAYLLLSGTVLHEGPETEIEELQRVVDSFRLACRAHERSSDRAIKVLREVEKRESEETKDD